MGGTPDHIEIERFSPFGDTPVLALDARDDAAPYREAQAIVIGLDRQGLMPNASAADFDILLTTAAEAPRPWVSIPAHAFDDRVANLQNAIRNTPHAASVLRQVLRLNENRGFDDGLLIESFAYSTLLGGGEFEKWRETTPATLGGGPANVAYARDGDHVVITLNQPSSRNAINAAMRDEVCNALISVLDDPSKPRVTLRGAGDCFSVGGDLAELGFNRDKAQAHTIRIMRSIARLVHELGDRIEVIFHGACIGSGLEGPAAAVKRIALAGAFFQLPELKMGLIPGAGGTVTIPRAIGRHRACFMMSGGARVSATTALHWGLVHEVRART